MSRMSINVEFLAGTDITNAVADAKHMAIRLNVAYIMFDFNGVAMSVGQNADIKETVNKFHSVLNDRSREYKSVVCN